MLTLDLYKCSAQNSISIQIVRKHFYFLRLTVILMGLVAVLKGIFVRQIQFYE